MTQRSGRKIWSGIVLMVLVCLLLCVSAVPGWAAESGPVREQLRVGFFAADGYHMQDENGVRSGYGYDFFKMAENYHNWKFEFIGYELGWSDMLSMLDAGQIDVLSFAQKTPEREEKYDFSAKPIGTGGIVLTTASGDDRYVIGDPATYEGMRIGIQRGSTHEALLDQLAEEGHFTYEPVLFDSLPAMEAALRGQEIDGMASSSERPLREEKVLETLETSDYYVIVKKGNTELLDQLNDAINKMDLNLPSWRTDLSHRYFTSREEEAFVFNKEELEYIQSLKENHTVFTVATNPDLAPYSSYDAAGQPVGIAPEIFKKIADQIGLQYKFAAFETYEEYNTFIRQGKADIDLTCFNDYGLAEDHGVFLTNPYMSTTLAMVTKDTYNGTLNSIAELKAVSNNTIYSDELLDVVDSQYYETHDDCVRAVLSGEVDATYLYTYTAQKAVEEDIKNRLLYSIMPEYEVSIAFGVAENLDYRLISILNEGIRCLKGRYIQQVIQGQISEIAEKDSVLSLIYDYPEAALGVLGVLLAAVFASCLLLSRSFNEKKRLAQAQEVSRFMGYVCEANETVMEVNMDTLECTKHTMKDGILVSASAPYEFYDLKNKGDQIYPEDFKRLTTEEEMAEFRRLFTEKDRQFYFEARAKDKDGAYRWYSYTIRAIPRSRKYPNNFVLFKKDIDESVRKNEEQRQALEDALQAAKNASSAKGQFLSRMSHEIRTPLNAVIGYMEIAKDSGNNPEKMMHCVENSDMAAKHLLSIINDVLDISSIESGKMKIASEAFDLKSQLTSISSIFFSQAREKKVKFEAGLKDVTEEWVVGDSLRVSQILMNLLSNAVKFTPEDGTVRLTVAQMKLEEKRVFLQFTVSDTGIGMSEVYQKRLFTPFEQESATTAQKYGGTGLGLSITNNLVHMMGGTMEVESQPGKGTVFRVFLHFDRCQEQPASAPVQHDYSHVRALIVDDDAAACEYMKALFKRCKVKCDVVQSGEAALKQLRRRMDTEYRYDLCIIDWNMPDMNGIETARRIRSEYDPKLPIIIATAYDVTEFEDQAKELGRG